MEFVQSATYLLLCLLLSGVIINGQTTGDYSNYGESDGQDVGPADVADFTLDVPGDQSLNDDEAMTSLPDDEVITDMLTLEVDAPQPLELIPFMPDSESVDPDMTADRERTTQWDSLGSISTGSTTSTTTVVTTTYTEENGPVDTGANRPADGPTEIPETDLLFEQASLPADNDGNTADDQQPGSMADLMTLPPTQSTTMASNSETDTQTGSTVMITEETASQPSTQRMENFASQTTVMEENFVSQTTAMEENFVSQTTAMGDATTQESMRATDNVPLMRSTPPVPQLDLQPVIETTQQGGIAPTLVLEEEPAPTAPVIVSGEVVTTPTIIPTTVQPSLHSIITNNIAKSFGNDGLGINPLTINNEDAITTGFGNYVGLGINPLGIGNVLLPGGNGYQASRKVSIETSQTLGQDGTVITRTTGLGPGGTIITDGTGDIVTDDTIITGGVGGIVPVNTIITGGVGGVGVGLRRGRILGNRAGGRSLLNRAKQVVNKLAGLGRRPSLPGRRKINGARRNRQKTGKGKRNNTRAGKRRNRNKKQKNRQRKNKRQRNRQNSRRKGSKKKPSRPTKSSN